MNQQLIWTTEKRVVDTLLAHTKSPRKISKDQAGRLKKSLEQFNLVEIPAIDQDGTILAGHQRIKVLQLLGRGKESIDVRVPNRKLTSKEADQYMIGSNTIHGDWDFELLKGFDIDILLDLGFEQKELDDIWKIQDSDKEFDVEKELKKIKKPTTSSALVL